MSVTFNGSNHHKPHPRVPGAFEYVDVDFGDPHFLNLANFNARALLALLGFAPAPAQAPHLSMPEGAELETENYLMGERSVLECRLAIKRARASFEAAAPRLTFASETLHGAPRENEDGTVELRPVRVHLTGLDADGLRSRLDRFERFVDYVAQKGATHVSWG